MSEQTSVNFGTQQAQQTTEGLSEHDTKMAQVFDDAQKKAAGEPVESQSTEKQTPENQTGEGELILGKFKNQEELAKAYEELSKKLGEQKPEVKPEEGQKTETPAADKEAAKAALQDKGIDYSQLSDEFQKEGVLTEASYEKLAKAGIPKNIVDAYIEGQKAVAVQEQQAAHAVVGGEKNFNEMVTWAKGSISDAEKAAFNNAVSGSDRASAHLAIQGLYARFVAANGQEPNLLSGGNNNVSAPQGFKSNAEIVKAMQDPRYAKDPAYRKEVERKLAVSNF